MVIDDRWKQLSAQVQHLHQQPGVKPSPVEHVNLIYVNEHQPRTPVMYQPSLIIILQGRKVGYLGERVFHYDPSNYLLMTLPLPCECETFATPQEPLIGLALRVDMQMLQDLLMDIGDGLHTSARPHADGVRSVALDEAMLCACERLVEVMETPLQARVLGPQIVREMLFHALCGAGGDALFALASRHSHFSQIAKALRMIEQNYARSLNIDSLAQSVNMSISSFHHNFKAVTATSPLQYIKSYRLHKARMMILHDGLKASTAANRVGYESPSQFSREYKRFFGNTPSDQASRYRNGGLPIAEL
ncbi:AraC family transcriptional regulator [Edwardsiella tarda]|uniref:AraC family transcriptional regulator n=1 Tax=Edwardsiella tarda TaxID=636 RepID=UPI002670B1BD|nr:AraC family transcriptional regulator [Edwardsiella tarda]WKS80976.1 AraC family transcriptional regulator [Edwardsiella tarda]